MAGTTKWDSLQQDIIVAVGKVAKKHKVVIEPAGYRYDDDA